METFVEKTCGKWKLGREIGRGAYGVVYAATDASGKAVAVKACSKECLSSERYTRELRGATLYQAIPAGEGLIRMLDLVVGDEGFYTVMELADDEFGGRADASSPAYRPKTLARVIAGEKALPLDTALTIAKTLAKGLVALQCHHLMHRDIKPENILYVRGKPVLSDIGLLIEETEAASLVGTPGYVPPENFTGAGSDVYSLGLTLKAVTFGRSVEELDRGPTLEADTGHPQFPIWWRLVNKATHPDPSRRYRSAKALLKDLNALKQKSKFETGIGYISWFAGLVRVALFIVFCLYIGWHVYWFISQLFK